MIYKFCNELVEHIILILHLGGSHTEKLSWTRYNGPEPSLGDMIWENTQLVRICISLEYPAKKICAKIAKKAKNDPSEEKVQKSQKIQKWKFYKKKPFAFINEREKGLIEFETNDTSSFLSQLRL